MASKLFPLPSASRTRSAVSFPVMHSRSGNGLGLWTSGQSYHVGEHLLLFLYSPSKIGLSSVVGGAMGRFRIDAAGRVLLTSQQISAFQRDPVLGGKSPVRLRDFALAVRQAREEE